jgi:hypothetical protein
MSKDTANSIEARAMNTSDELMKNLSFLLQDARQRCSNQVRELALTGEYNPLISSRIEKLKEETSSTVLTAYTQCDMSEQEANEIRKQLEQKVLHPENLKDKHLKIV